MINKNELYNNGYGGFSEDGKEYILKDIITPTPWSHILTNGRIGTIITNGGGGSTWYINSRENKLTSWSNDTITDKASEIIYLEDEKNKWSVMPIEKNNNEYEIVYGFGYAKYILKNEEYDQETTVFVCNTTDEKVSLIKLKNITKNQKNIKINYLAEMVLGVDIEYTRKHIVAKSEENRLKLYNKYNENYVSLRDRGWADVLADLSKRSFLNMDFHSCAHFYNISWRLHQKHSCLNDIILNVIYDTEVYM